MSGLKVLESVIDSINEARHNRPETSGEILCAPYVARQIIRVGSVLGVQEISLNEFATEDLKTGEMIKISDRIRYERGSAAHLYEVSNALRTDSKMRVLTYHSDDDFRPQIHEASTTFSSAFRDYNNRFKEGLTPIVRYSIVTPVVSIEFPNVDHGRYMESWRTSTTRGTAVVDSPFRIGHHGQTEEILRILGINSSDKNYLASIATFEEQAARVVRAVATSSDFHSFTNHCVQLSAELDKISEKEFRASIK